MMGDSYVPAYYADRPDLSAFTRLDGLELARPDHAVLACRIVEDQWCRRCEA